MFLRRLLLGTQYHFIGAGAVHYDSCESDQGILILLPHLGSQLSDYQRPWLAGSRFSKYLLVYQLGRVQPLEHSLVANEDYTRRILWCCTLDSRI